MKLEAQVVSLDLAKRLKALGVKQEALCWWSEHTIPQTLWYEGPLEVAMEGAEKGDIWERYAAFTVAELGETLPKKVEQVRKGGTSRTGFWLNISFDGTSNKWRYSYANHRANECLEMWFEENEAEARGLMLAYLIENNLM